jgi:urease accessory protein
MWCDRILGNIAAEWDGHGPDAAWAGRRWDIVDIAWPECGRLLRKQTREGRAVRILLPPGERITHGDVVFDDGTLAIVIRVVRSEVVVVKTKNAMEAARLALELGNLHWPTQITEDEILFPEDGPALAAVAKCGLTGSREMRLFQPSPVENVVVTRADGFGIIKPG